MTSVGIATGAGRGMGAACAARLVDIVDVVLLVDRDEPAAEQTAHQLAPARFEPFAVDVTDPEGLARLATRVTELGTLRAVSHAAGISPTMADWHDVVKVDLVGSALLVEALLPLVTAGTAMVFFASIAPHIPMGDIDTAAEAALDEPLDPRLYDRLRDVLGPSIEDPGLAYLWAKRGVLRLVQREAIRMGRRGGRICSVSPGIIDTPMGRQEDAARSTNALLVQHTPMGREGQPEEVAATVAFLLSDEAGFVNGIDVRVDGGVIAALRVNGFDL